MFTVEQIENTCSTLAKVAKKKFIIDGVEVEKGSLMTKKRIEENYELYTKWLEYWINYPDLFERGA